MPKLTKVAIHELVPADEEIPTGERNKDGRIFSVSTEGKGDNGLWGIVDQDGRGQRHQLQLSPAGSDKRPPRLQPPAPPQPRRSSARPLRSDGRHRQPLFPG